MSSLPAARSRSALRSQAPARRTETLEVQFTGTSLIGLSQWITITGWITSGTSNPDGSVTLNGVCTLDMGDGTAPTGGLPLVANAGPAGLTLTVGSTTLPTLPKSDGWVINE